MFMRRVGALFLWDGNPVSRQQRPVPAETRFEWRAITRKSKHLTLAGPFGRQVGEAGNSHAVREASFDRSLDEVGREEGKRDSHVDLADTLPASRSVPR
jgi:hypothetical protein